MNAQGKLKVMRGDETDRKRATWRHVRELWVPPWNEAFRQFVLDATGERDFACSVAVTRLSKPADEEAAAAPWGDDPAISASLTAASSRSDDAGL